MQNGFDPPSRLSSRKEVFNPSDARQKKQRAPLHRRRRRKEACRRNPRTSHGREEAGVESNQHILDSVFLKVYHSWSIKEGH
jgi:hypothetical protein